MVKANELLSSDRDGELKRSHQLTRLFWNILWMPIQFCVPSYYMGGLKRALLRMFGAKIHSTAMVYSSAKIYYPANLTMKAHSILGPKVDCYNVAMVTLEECVTVSQKAYLCTASHDINDPKHTLIVAPITIEKNAWVAADAFVGMGVIIGEGAVVGARSSVFKNVEPWTVVGGNPATFIKTRVLKSK